jgi:myo-inositol catabolism protein IolC
VSCIVLGRGGNEEKVTEWLRTGAGVPGYVGFAVGRTIWWDPLSDWLGGGDADEAAAAIASNYRRLIDVYTTAAAGAR